MPKIFLRGTHSNIAKQFYENSEHQWILSDQRILECFKLVLETLNKNKRMQSFLKNSLFIRTNGSYACAITGKKIVILIYPELISIMKSNNYKQAVAVLLHEVGHIILDHQQRDITNTMAQIEADLFSSELGYGEYLFDFLNERNQGPQIQKRLQALKHVLKKSALF
ncbi:hypothetical protein A9Q84_02670 [Halobacteriovorax marinus]|uniref:Peptidase M48 domain-containing protein n=1 Tax=Halobacteriovorax marinus TaxID=97084 RepID=A0A1Y5FCM3_9BACT|nr:hypothetical protein A9Q84_02670 [Halobacteriovorax marinus]